MPISSPLAPIVGHGLRHHNKHADFLATRGNKMAEVGYATSQKLDGPHSNYYLRGFWHCGYDPQEEMVGNGWHVQVAYELHHAGTSWHELFEGHGCCAKEGAVDAELPAFIAWSKPLNGSSIQKVPSDWHHSKSPRVPNPYQRSAADSRHDYF